MGVQHGLQIGGETHGANREISQWVTVIMRQLCLNAESDAMKLAIITVLDLTGVASCVSGSASQMTGGASCSSYVRANRGS